ncbi:nuclear transport factor 2 family protein [Nocardia sp. NPDC051832]|uniref:nuclear transport factor 2 family protein n=1 Tax=Nocardia sp. NPDC051832 TaxID=3155673 RepID=UPI003432835B
MTTAANRALVRTVFDQLAQGNTRALGDALADDCRWTFPGNWSWSATWQPKKQVLHGLLRPLLTQLGNAYRMEADMLLADGDHVVVQARGYGVTVDGHDYHQTYCFIFRLAGGRIVEVLEHCDTALVERVLKPVAAKAN